MQYQPLPTGQNYWQPAAPIYYPDRALHINGLGAIHDVKPVQVAGAVGGGILGALMAGVVQSVLPRKWKDTGTLLGIGLTPAMAIAGWFLFQESYDFDFTQ